MYCSFPSRSARKELVFSGPYLGCFPDLMTASITVSCFIFPLINVSNLGANTFSFTTVVNHPNPPARLDGNHAQGSLLDKGRADTGSVLRHLERHSAVPPTAFSFLPPN